MKNIVIISSVVGLALGCGACERHAWSETKALHEQHGHGSGHAEAAAGHGDAAGESGGGHGADAGHGEKEAGH